MPESLKINPVEPITETPAQVEDQLIQKEMSPLSGLAEKIQLMKYPFVNIVDGLSNKSLKRLIKALVMMPLEDEVKPNFKNAGEKLAWQMGEEILMAKMTLIHYSMLEHEIAKDAERKNLQATQPQESIVQSTGEELSVKEPV